MESFRNPGGIQVEIDKNLAGLPAKEIPGGMTRNLWGSVKSSPPPLPPPPTAAAAGSRFNMSRAFGMFSSAVAQRQHYHHHHHQLQEQQQWQQQQGIKTQHVSSLWYIFIVILYYTVRLWNFMDRLCQPMERTPRDKWELETDIFQALSYVLTFWKKNSFSTFYCFHSFGNTCINICNKKRNAFK